MSLLVLVGVGLLVWWLLRQTSSFPGQFATLLTLPQRPVTATSYFTGRFRVLGWFKERQVLLVFQRPGRHRPGYLVAAMQTTVPDQSIVQSRPDGSAAPDRDLERALFVLEGKHALRLDVGDGWLRATWMPAGFTIFPGSFDASKWNEVLENMRVTVERLEAAAVAKEPPAPEVTASEPPQTPPAARSAPVTVAPDWQVGLTGRPLTRERTRGLRVFKALGTLVLSAGLSMLVASVPLLVVNASQVATFARVAVLLAAILIATGAATRYVSTTSRALLINEGDHDGSVERTPFGGWLWLLLATLVLLPIWMLDRLRPLAALWRDILTFMDQQGVWDQLGAGGMSGLVFLPVAAVLSVPALDAAVAVGVALGAVLLIVLLVTRNPRFPRAYLAFAVLLVGLVIASQVATGAAIEAGRIIESKVDASTESQQARAAIASYGQLLQDSALVLLIVAVGLGLWTLALFTSRRIHTTFAPPPGEADGG